VDHAHQRRRPRQRHDLQPLRPGPQGRGRRGRPQGLAEIAVTDEAAFAALVEVAKANLPAKESAAKESAAKESAA
jgi:hypothetical protein